MIKNKTLPIKIGTIFCFLLLANLLSGSTKTENYHIFSEEDTTVYEKADRAPRFTGESNWIGKRTMYPPEFEGKYLDGKVYVSFVIEKDGTVSHVTLVEGCHPKLDSLVFNAVKAYPKWEPAMINGKPVRFRKIEKVRYVKKNNIIIFPKDPAVAQAFSKYLQDLYKEEEILIREEEPSQEEKTKKINALRGQFGDDTSFQKIILATLQEKKAHLDSNVKAQSILLQLDAKGTEQLKEIYQKELAEKFKLIENLGKEQFITKFVGVELRLRKIEIDKTLAIKELLDKEFWRYFENVVLKE